MSLSTPTAVFPVGEGFVSEADAVQEHVVCQREQILGNDVPAALDQRAGLRADLTSAIPARGLAPSSMSRLRRVRFRISTTCRRIGSLMWTVGTASMHFTRSSTVPTGPPSIASNSVFAMAPRSSRRTPSARVVDATLRTPGRASGS